MPATANLCLLLLLCFVAVASSKLTQLQESRAVPGSSTTAKTTTLRPLTDKGKQTQLLFGYFPAISHIACGD
ncbi:hypothetical protein ACLKA7_013645 [Drosophila subpalustris]